MLQWKYRIYLIGVGFIVKKVIITSAILAILVVLSRDVILNSLLLFLFAGVVPGLNIALPFWFMLAFYCLLIAAIVTLYVERVFDFLNPTKTQSPSKPAYPSAAIARFNRWLAISIQPTAAILVA